MLYDDEPRDYGFDLPDDRETYILKEGGKITLTIVRDRVPVVVEGEDGPEVIEGEYTWAMWWVAKKNGQTVVGPHPDEDAVRLCIETLYGDQIDKEASIDAEHDRRTQFAEMGYRC